MKFKTLILLAAVLIFIHLLGHAVGHAGWDKPEDPAMQAVVNSMKRHSSSFMGATKSMADYFQGYSLIMFGLYGFTIAVLLGIFRRAEADRALAHRILLPMAVAYLYFGVIEYVYFFPFAGFISLLSGILLLLSLRTK